MKKSNIIPLLILGIIIGAIIRVVKVSAPTTTNKAPFLFGSEVFNPADLGENDFDTSETTRVR